MRLSPAARTYPAWDQHPKGLSAQDIVTCVVAPKASKLAVAWSIALIGAKYTHKECVLIVSNIMRFALSGIPGLEHALYVPSAASTCCDEWVAKCSGCMENWVKTKLAHRRYIRNALHFIYNSKLDENATPAMKEVLKGLGCPDNFTVMEKLVLPESENTTLFPMKPEDVPHLGNAIAGSRGDNALIDTLGECCIFSQIVYFALFGRFTGHMLAGSVLHLNREYVDRGLYGLCLEGGPKVPDTVESPHWGTFGDLFCYLALGLWGYHDELPHNMQAYGQSFRLSELLPGVPPWELAEIKVPALPEFSTDHDSSECPEEYLLSVQTFAYLDCLVHLAVQKDGAKKGKGFKGEPVEQFYDRMVALYQSGNGISRKRLHNRLAKMASLLEEGKRARLGSHAAGGRKVVRDEGDD